MDVFLNGVVYLGVFSVFAWANEPATNDRNETRVENVGCVDDVGTSRAVKRLRKINRRRLALKAPGSASVL